MSWKVRVMLERVDSFGVCRELALNSESDLAVVFKDILNRARGQSTTAWGIEHHQTVARMSGMLTEHGPTELVTSMENDTLMGGVRDEVIGYRLLLLVRVAQ
jgi:hypothetical protein